MIEELRVRRRRARTCYPRTAAYWEWWLTPIVPLQMTAGTVHDGHVDVDPELLNRSGILFKFMDNFDVYNRQISYLVKSPSAGSLRCY